MPQKQLTKQQLEEVQKHVDKRLSKHIPTKVEYARQQFKQHVSTAIIAAFSFLIALSWKDLIVDFVKVGIAQVTLEQYPYLSTLITAIIVTIVAIIGIALVTRWVKDPKVIVSETKTE